MPNAYEADVVSITERGCDVVQLTLRRPRGYEFSAGQWLRLSLETESGVVTKTFSHASAPSDEYLDMATRLTGSTFKRALEALRPGDKVAIAGPGGRLSLPVGATRVAFLTGGVGVTPVRSFLRDAAAHDSAFDDALVLYGSREAGCALYLEELSGLSRWGVRVVPVYETPPSGWEGDTGFITAATIVRHVDPADGRPFVVTGPPPMVGAMNIALDELGVEPERRLIERFGV